MLASQKPIQFTLSTAVVMMFAAAILLYMNLHALKVGVFLDLIIVTAIMFVLNNRTSPNKYPWVHYLALALCITAGTFAVFSGFALLGGYP
jgi:hypothetical protein